MQVTFAIRGRACCGVDVKDLRVRAHRSPIYSLYCNGKGAAFREFFGVYACDQHFLVGMGSAINKQLVDAIFARIIRFVFLRVVV
jgi:hypothetical protein